MMILCDTMYEKQMMWKTDDVAIAKATFINYV